MIDAALVLEGGAMRGIYTAGVLDVLMEKEIEFSYVIAASSGALVAVNYISKQIGRAARVNLLHSKDHNFFGFRQFFRSAGNAFNFDYLFNEPINSLYPYDEKTLRSSKQKFYVIATNCKTGQPEYFSRSTYEEMANVLIASGSVPLLTRMAYVDEVPYYDAYISDPFGLKKAMADGCKKIVVVSTRPAEYRKKNHTSPFIASIKMAYAKYPELVKTWAKTSQLYNQVAEEMIQMEREGKIIVVRPQKPLNVSAMERNTKKLLLGYLQGRDDICKKLPAINDYLGRLDYVEVLQK